MHMQSELPSYSLYDFNSPYLDAGTGIIYFTDSSLSCTFTSTSSFSGICSLKGIPSEIDLDDVSKIAGDKWRSLLTYLGVPLAKCKAL